MYSDNWIHHPIMARGAPLKCPHRAQLQTPLGGRSMRLRQRQEFGPYQPMRVELWNGPTLVVAWFDQQLPNFGTAQMVKDQFAGPPQRINRKVLKHLAVPPLNTAQFAKISRNVPQGSYKYYCSSPPYVYRFTGGPLSAAPIENATLPMPEQRPPGDQTALSFVTVNDAEASYLYQRAISKSSSAEFDFGVTLGEVAETASFLAGPLRGIVKASNLAFAGVRAVYKHGPYVALQIANNATAKQRKRLMQNTLRHPVSSGLRIIDESANHWLAYKFAVCPILDDIAKAMDFEDAGLAQRMGVQCARVKGPMIGNTSIVMKQRLVHGAFYYDLKLLIRQEDRHYFGLYWKHNVQAPLLNFMEGLGFAPWQLPSLAWELVPLSFVVDRFIDIKSFVRGNIGSLTKQFFGTYCTRKVMTYYNYEISNIRYNSYNGPVVSLENGKQLPSCDALYERMTRVIDSARPNFPVINPHWQRQLVADATNLSLIWGRLRTYVGRINS